MNPALKICALGFSAISLCLSVGCNSNGVRIPKIPAKSYEAQNVYSLEFIPATMVRVAVLPSYHPEEDPAILASFDNTILSELTKNKLFELVRVDRTYLKKHFNFEQIDSTQPLPTSMMSRIIKDFGAQGVLFTDVTDYQPYRPIRVGLRSKLVDLRDGNLVWVFDDIFDSSQPNVSAAAQRYARRAAVDRFPLDTAESMLQSPQRFTRYVMHETFATVPSR